MPTGFSLVPPQGPAKPGDRQRVIRPKLLGRARGHRNGGLGAHGPVLEQQAFGNVQELHLGIVRVAHAPSREKLRGAADVGERVGEEAAGRGFGDCEALFLRSKEVGAHLRKRVVAARDEILPEEVGAFVRDFTDRFHAEGAAGRTQPAVDMTRMGAERHAKAGAVAVEDGLELRLKHRFPDSRCPQLHVGLICENKPQTSLAGEGPAP